MIKSEIERALEILNRGGVIAYPTDTLFGIGCDAINQNAIKKIYEIKGRDFSKPLSIACSDIKMVKQYAEINDDTEKMIKKILPGPYTIVLNKKDRISSLVTAGSDMVGVRIPDDDLLLEIIKKYDKPIITTSANLSGMPDITKYEDITLKVDYIIKGRCKYNQPSTVFNPVDKKILRRGVNSEKIDQLLGEE